MPNSFFPRNHLLQSPQNCASIVFYFLMPKGSFLPIFSSQLKAKWAINRLITTASGAMTWLAGYMSDQ